MKISIRIPREKNPLRRACLTRYPPKSDMSHKHASTQISNKEPSRTTDKLRKTEVSKSTGSSHARTIRSSAKSSTTAGHSRETVIKPKSNEKSSHGYEKTVATSRVATSKTKSGMSTTTKKLPEYATRGLSKQQIEVQQALEMRVPCPAGFIWLKQDVGWRCEGGNHWLMDRQADRLARGEDPGRVLVNWAKPHPEVGRTFLVGDECSDS